MIQLREEKEKALKARKAQHKLLDRLKKNPPRDLDTVVLEADEEVFRNLDCLECANCCKTISPIFTPRDVERIAAVLGMSPGKFMQTYLCSDEDHDMVLLASPCPFLAEDNRCSIYEARPRACRDYPHTGQRKFHAHIGITKKNILVCPAAFRVVEHLQRIYGQ